MSKLKFKPVNDEIYLQMEDAKLGGLVTDSVKTGQEWGIITAIGPDVKDKELKVGARVFCKGWGMDSILFEGKTYVFVTEARHAIKAILL